MTSIRRLILFIGLGLTVLAANAFAQDAKILRIIGNAANATVTKPGQAPVPATQNMAIAQNDTLTTGAGVELYVQTYPGAIATIKQNTIILMERLGTNQVTLDLKQGDLVSQLDPAKQSDYQVRTPRGVAAARGTVYVTTVNGVSYSVSVLAGNVSVSPIDANGVVGTAVPVVSGTSSANGANATALASNPDVGNISAAAMAAVAVARETGALDAAASLALLNQTVKTVVDTGNRDALAQATAAAAAAAPGQAADIVTAAITGATSAMALEIATTVTQAAAQGVGQAAAQTAVQTGNTGQSAIDSAGASASAIARAATLALKIANPNASTADVQQIVNAATTGATAGLTSSAIVGNTLVGLSAAAMTSLTTEIAEGAVAGANAGGGTGLSAAIASAQAEVTNTQVTQGTTTPITPIDPSIIVNPSPAGD